MTYSPNPKIDTIKTSSNTVDENEINALNDIIITCQKKNIDLILVYSPIRKIIQNNYLNSVLTELILTRGIRYIDLSNSPEFINNQGYFADLNHLNDEGAKVFSNIIIDKIIENQ